MLAESPADPPARVLFIEDNQSLVANVFAYLEGGQWVLDAAPDGTSGLQLALDNEYDVIVLDWMLPRLDGIEVLRRLRASGADVPILMLTARDELDSKLDGFRAGADDYLSKPFAIAELEARIAALSLRRRGRGRQLRVGDLRYDLRTQEIFRGERPLQLHTGCRAILEILMRESPAVVTKERLEAAIWGEQRPDRDLLRSHIYELRRRLDGEGQAKLLHTIKSVGYRLIEPGARP